jgi:hypothetical protein
MIIKEPHAACHVHAGIVVLCTKVHTTTSPNSQDAVSLAF